MARSFRTSGARAFVTGEATLRFDPADPFRAGFTAAR